MKRVEYRIDHSQLKKGYKQLFHYSDMQKKWKKLQRDYAFVLGRGSFPTVLQLLTAPIDTLVDVYFDYVQKVETAVNNGTLTKGKTGTKKAMKDEIAKVFDYDGYSDVIAGFFMDSANKFEIYTCHYCEMAYVNYFEANTGRKIRQFDVEHILDKGKCPLVALSLYNFLPSCQPCNSKMKGQKCVGETANSIKTGRLKDIVLKLSPTNPQYDFTGNLSFYIKPLDPANRNFDELVEHKDDFELDFHVDGDEDYMFMVEQFHLKERYNFHKMEAFRLKDMFDHYPESKRQEIAKIVGRSEKEVAEDLFGEDFRINEHRVFSKLYRDVTKAYLKP